MPLCKGLAPLAYHVALRYLPPTYNIILPTFKMVTSPADTRRLLGKSSGSGTPRVGMHLYQNDDDDDDDVSVLTFHTMGTQLNDTRRLSGGGGSNYIKSARQSLDRLSLFDGKTMASGDLLRISEEESQMSSCHSKNSRSRSSVSTRDEEEQSKEKEVDDEEEDDDDTISLAQSVLTNTNKVLSNIDSSPYRRNKREASSTTRKESPIKSNDDKDRNKEDRKYTFVNTSISDMKKPYNFTSTKDKISNDTKLEVSSNFLRSYFRDDGNENRKPTTTNRYHNQDRSKSSSITTSRLITKCDGIRDTNKEKHIKQLESETKQLQELLKERQNETRKSSETLGTSIRNANKLLEKISVGRKI